jgi:hypothetical protein
MYDREVDLSIEYYRRALRSIGRLPTEEVNPSNVIRENAIERSFVNQKTGYMLHSGQRLTRNPALHWSTPPLISCEVQVQHRSS